MYYLCKLPSYKAIAGPFDNWRDVAALVDAQKNPKQYCSMSRYLLAKAKVYPRTAAGEKRLAADLAQTELVKIGGAS